MHRFLLVVGLPACGLVTGLEGFEVDGAVAAAGAAGVAGAGDEAGRGGMAGAGGGGGAAGMAGAGGEAGSGPVSQVSCDGAMCAPGEVCCFDSYASQQLRCAAPGACSQGEIPIACDGPEDCDPSLWCCGRWTPQDLLLELACATSCDDAYAWIYCHDENDCQGDEGCQASLVGAPYGYCD